MSNSVPSSFSSLGFVGAILKAKYGDLVREGSKLLQTVVEGVADLQEAQTRNGVSRKSETRTAVTKGDGKTSTERTSHTTITVDHLKQAQFLREEVSPGITKFTEGLLDKGEVVIGKQRIPLEEIIGFAQKVSKALRTNNSGDGEIVTIEEPPQAPDSSVPPS